MFSFNVRVIYLLWSLSLMNLLKWLTKSDIFSPHIIILLAWQWIHWNHRVIYLTLCLNLFDFHIIIAQIYVIVSISIYNNSIINIIAARTLFLNLQYWLWTILIMVYIINLQWWINLSMNLWTSHESLEIRVILLVHIGSSPYNIHINSVNQLIFLVEWTTVIWTSLWVQFILEFHIQ